MARRLLGPSTANGSAVEWHPAALASRVVECFNAVQLAWTRRDAQELAPYVSDAMGARIDSWFDSFEDLSQVNRIENLELEHATLARIEFGDSAEGDRLVAAVGFSARDWLEDVRTGAILDGHPGAETRFDQQWTFVHDAERGWVVDTVEPRSQERPPPPAAAYRPPAPPPRRSAPPRADPALRPRPAPAPRFTGTRPGAAQGRRGSIPGHPGAAPMAHPSTPTTTGDALRVALVLLLCVAVVAGAARAGLSLGQSSVAGRADAERTRLQARQAIAGPAFRRSYSQSEFKGRATGLIRGRKAGRTRGTLQGRRAGRAQAQRQANARAAAAAATAAAAARASTTAAGRSATSGAATSTGATTPRR